MQTVDLFNLYVGENLPDPHWSNVTIGPFEVQLVPDYEERIALLGQNASKTVKSELTEGTNEGDPLVSTKTTTYQKKRRGGWEVTAKVTFDDSVPCESILLRRSSPDNGIWDLCTLLTFASGRRVVVEKQREQYDPNRYGPRACVPIETLHAARVAWTHRQEVIDRGLLNSLLMHNEALGYSLLQVSAALNSTALNVLVDKWSKTRNSPERKVRQELKKLVNEAVDSLDKLKPAEKESYKALLGARVDQGLGASLTNRTESLLCDLGIVSAPVAEQVKRRIQWMNKVRNDLVHSGEPRVLPGLDEEQSLRVVGSVVTGVVPEICITALGRVLGFQAGAVGSLSQNNRDVATFFAKGTWRGWELLDKSFDDWFYEESNAIFDALSSEAD